MGYMHINNLYKDQTVLSEPECYALEKVHGTSAHVSWKDGALTLFHGGENRERFLGIFDLPELTRRFQAFGHDHVVVFGEAYGGKQQAMSNTYGPDLCFIAFDVKVRGEWLNVPEMARISGFLGFEVVPWECVPTDLSVLDAIRDRPSEVAVRRGCGHDKIREGIVLRPIVEKNDRRGNRIIAKHKGDNFRETKTPRKVVDPSEQLILREAQAIADEWVTEMRLSHVLGKLPEATSVEHTRLVLDAMLADIHREGVGEFVVGKAVNGAICRKTAVMFKERLKRALTEGTP